MRQTDRQIERDRERDRDRGETEREIERETEREGNRDRKGTERAQNIKFNLQRKHFDKEIIKVKRYENRAGAAFLPGLRRERRAF